MKNNLPKAHLNRLGGIQSVDSGGDEFEFGAEEKKRWENVLKTQKKLWLRRIHNGSHKNISKIASDVILRNQNVLF